MYRHLQEAGVAIPQTRILKPSDITPETAQQVPTAWKSRPADPLIGRIPRERAGDAGTRIDTIFADRLEGYRGRTLARGRTP